MSVRAGWPLPFQWGPGPNPGDVEPAAWTMQKCLDAWWKWKILKMALSFNATYDGATRGYSHDLYLTRDQLDAGEVAHGLVHPGCDAVWDALSQNQWLTLAESEVIADWGGSDGDHPVLDHLTWAGSISIFATSGFTPRAAARGTYSSLADIRPALDLSASIGVIGTGSDPGKTNATGVDFFNAGTTSDGSFGGTITGDAFTALYTTFANSDDPITFTGITFNSGSMVITLDTEFAY